MITDAFGARIPSTAARGDLLAIVTDGGSRVDLAVATAASRSGIATAARCWDGTALNLTAPDPARRVLVVPAARVDVVRALSAVPGAFPGVQDCQAFTRQFLLPEKAQ